MSRGPSRSHSSQSMWSAHSSFRDSSDETQGYLPGDTRDDNPTATDEDKHETEGQPQEAAEEHRTEATEEQQTEATESEQQDAGSRVQGLTPVQARKRARDVLDGLYVPPRDAELQTLGRSFTGTDLDSLNAFFSCSSCTSKRAAHGGQEAHNKGAEGKDENNNDDDHDNGEGGENDKEDDSDNGGGGADAVEDQDPESDWEARRPESPGDLAAEPVGPLYVVPAEEGTREQREQGGGHDADASDVDSGGWYAGEDGDTGEDGPVVTSDGVALSPAQEDGVRRWMNALPVEVGTHSASAPEHPESEHDLSAHSESQHGSSEHSGSRHDSPKH